MVEKIPGIPQLGKLVAKGTSGRAGSVQGKPPLSGWAKAQAMMMYAQEHKERWVHNGFLQVPAPNSSVLSPRKHEECRHEQLSIALSSPGSQL